MQEIKKGSAGLINQRNSERGKVWMDDEAAPSGIKI